MDAPIRDFQRGDIRVSDAERDLAVAELSEHYQSGRLTLDEFDDRSSLALRAQTGNDIKALFTDLPTGAAPGVRVWAGLAKPAGPADRPVLPVHPGRRTGGLPVARAVIAFVVAAIALANLTGEHGHHVFGWLVPLVVLAFVLVRLARRR